MAYEPMDFSRLLGMKGFSDALLQDHFKLYEGYVTNTNQLLEKMEAMASEKKHDSVEFSELRRRLGWEFNGMRLHELYFGNLGGNIGGDGRSPNDAGGQLNEYFSSAFGGYEPWLAEFKAVGGMRGVGWAILYYDDRADRIHNFWIGEHDVGHPAGCLPLLVMDVWEHAFVTDYRTDRAYYIEAFVSNVDWKEVEKRLLAPNPSEVSARR